MSPKAPEPIFLPTTHLPPMRVLTSSAGGSVFTNFPDEACPAPPPSATPSSPSCVRRSIMFVPVVKGREECQSLAGSRVSVAGAHSMSSSPVQIIRYGSLTVRHLHRQSRQDIPCSCFCGNLCAVVQQEKPIVRQPTMRGIAKGLAGDHRAQSRRREMLSVVRADSHVYCV